MMVQLLTKRDSCTMVLYHSQLSMFCTADQFSMITIRTYYQIEVSSMPPNLFYIFALNIQIRVGPRASLFDPRHCLKSIMILNTHHNRKVQL